MNNLKVKSRLIEFDVIKCIAIFLVLWGHSILHLSSANRYDNGMFQLISSFHMPLFMLVSGFFANSSMSISFKQLVSKKFWKLIYPCISFGIVYLAVIFIWDILETSNNHSINFLNYLYGVFWFLKSVFVCYIVTYICIKLAGNKLVIGGLLAVLLSQVMPLFKVNWMLPFFVTGLLLNGHYNYFKRNAKWIFILSVISFGILFICIDIGYIDNIIQSIKNSLLGGDYSVIEKLVKIQLIRYLIGIAGSFMIMSLVIILMPFYNKEILVLFGEYGKETMGIYIIQTLLLEIVCSRLIDLSVLNMSIFSYIICPVISLVIMYLCVLLIKGLRKCSYIDLLFFGK